MDPSLIRRLQRLHVLRASAAAPAGQAAQHGRRSMEALVRDLSHALDESSSSSHRRRRGWRRRSRSAGNLTGAPPRTYSEDSGSSVGEAHLSTERQISSVQVSDSDEMLTSAGILSHSRRSQRHRLAVAASGLAGPMAESDSVNENFSPARLQRRKRKLKRMALDAELSQPSTSVGLVDSSVSELRRKRSKMQDSYGEGRGLGLVLGKRKCGRKEAGSMFPPRCPDDDAEDMECSDLDRLHGELMSSSSLSSGGESDGLDDPGGYTNDEGREGDDEQSDWYHEPTEELTEATASRRLAVKPSREIRAGRRRLRDRRPAFSIVSSLNDRVAAFLQDPLQTEIRLQTSGGKAEEDQLGHLASLYSLRLHRDAPGAFSAFKTGMTTRGVLVDPDSVWSGCGDMKRRRRAPASAPAEPAAADAGVGGGGGGGGDTFCTPAAWLTTVPPTISETSLDGSAAVSSSRPTSGDGHTPVPESSSPQTTEEPLSPMNDAE